MAREAEELASWQRRRSEARRSARESFSGLATIFLTVCFLSLLMRPNR